MATVYLAYLLEPGPNSTINLGIFMNESRAKRVAERILKEYPNDFEAHVSEFTINRVYNRGN